jgi:hypothetical protein
MDGTGERAWRMRRLQRRYGRSISPITKPGQHGPLYRYVVEYTDTSDPGFGIQTWHAWAYNLEHAEEKFYDSNGEDGFEGTSIVSVRRLLGDSAGNVSLTQHRAIRHVPGRGR